MTDGDATGGGGNATGDRATPLTTKLGIKEGITLALIGAPHNMLTELPSGVRVKRRARGPADVVVAFFVRRVEFERRVDALGAMVFPSGGLWIAWPKRSSGMETDITDQVAREVALPRGLVDNKVCAVDGSWTGLRFVWRLERRGAGQP
jgi:hypothetical protein